MRFSDLSAEQAAEWAEKRYQALLPLLTSSVVPILADHKPSPVQCGTGTLFKIADHHFLVTASHVANFKTIHQIQLCISDNAPNQLTDAIPLSGKLHFENGVDIAVLELPEEIVKRLPNRTFLNSAHMMRSLQDCPVKDGIFLVHGYPTLQSFVIASQEPRIVVMPITKELTLFVGEPTFENYNPHLNVLFNLAPGSLHCRLESVSGPELGGISGCSIWSVGDSNSDVDNWSLDQVRVVAVEHGVYKTSRVVKGTYWMVVYELIRKMYPELHRSMSLFIPK